VHINYCDNSSSHAYMRVCIPLPNVAQWWNGFGNMTLYGIVPVHQSASIVKTQTITTLVPRGHVRVYTCTCLYMPYSAHVLWSWCEFVHCGLLESANLNPVLAINWKYISRVPHILSPTHTEITCACTCIQQSVSLHQ
jgi:hypothetical protein